MIVCGVMSGTSLDGIDIVVANIEKGATRLMISTLFSKTFYFSSALRQQLQVLINGESVTPQNLAETEELYEAEVCSSILRAQ